MSKRPPLFTKGYYENIESNLKVVFVLFGLIALIISTAVFGTGHSFFHNRVSGNFDFDDNWHTEDGAVFKDFAKDIEQKQLTIHKTVSHTNKDNALGIYNYYAAVEVKLNDQSLFSYGDIDSLKNNVRLGNLYSIIRLPDNCLDDSVISISYQSNYPLNIYQIDFGDYDLLISNQQVLHLPVIFGLSVALIVVFSIICLLINGRIRSIMPKTFFWVGALATVSALWIAADSQLFMMLGFNAGVVCQFSFVLYPLFSLAILRATHFVTDTKSRFANIVYLLILINMSCVCILDYLDIIPFLHSLISTHIITVLSMIATFGLSYREFKDKHTLNSIYTYIGTCSFMILAGIQYFLFFINPSGSNSNLLIIALLILLIFFALRIVHTIMLALKKNDDFYKKTIEDTNNELRKRNALLYKTFGKFVPDESIDSLLSNDGGSSISGRQVNATIMECDIRDFSSLIKNMEAENAIDMLNNYFKTASEIIMKYSGTVIEYEGDSVLAVFGAPIDDEHHQANAVAAALELQLAIPGVNKFNKDNNYPQFEIGVGINTGDVYIGYLGSEKHMKFDIIGVAVNIASRIQSYTIGGQILISDTTRTGIDNLDIIFSETVHPKGVENDLNIYSVSGIGHPYNISYLFKKQENIIPDKPIELSFRKISDKHIEAAIYKGQIISYNDLSLMFNTYCELSLFENIELLNKNNTSYGKVVGIHNDLYEIHLSSSVKSLI